MKSLQTHPDAWTRVDYILETTTNNQTKFYALSVLEAVITTRWGALPEAQREGIKTYVSNLIIKISTDEGSFRRERTFLGKLNLVLVDILKQDWPHRWPSFIPDIVGASKTNETLCENSMHILRLLSEEVFDFSKNSLTVRVCAVGGGAGMFRPSRFRLRAPDLCTYSSVPPAIMIRRWRRQRR